MYVDCKYEGPDFLIPSYRVRYVRPGSARKFFGVDVFWVLDSDTLEQIDVAKLLIEQYPDVRCVIGLGDDLRPLLDISTRVDCCRRSQGFARE